MDIYDWAKNQTLTLQKQWENHPYHLFIHKASKTEFFESQAPFYFAVDQFPVLLLQLAHECLSVEQRTLVIKNIYDKHSPNDLSKSHTHTFLDYLLSICENEYITNHHDLLQYISKHKNPHISMQVSVIKEKNWTTYERASYLAGIEYAYAVISQDIANKLNSWNLLDKQIHYHSQNDWKYGKDLLITAEKCGEPSKELFIQAQIDFLKMYEHMIVLTQTDIKEMSNNPISFFFSREDSKLEIKVFNQLTVADPKIFTICSGGEHIISYLQQQKSCQITVMDSNSAQLDVLQTKLKLMNTHQFKQLNTYLQTQGKFEQLIAYFRVFTGNYTSDSYIKYAVQQVFNDKVLRDIFGDNAVKFSEGQDFIKHFYNVIRTGIFDVNDITDNILYNDITFNYELPLNSKSSINYVCNSLQNYQFSDTYDLIDLSNIGDWMPESEFIAILKKSKQALNTKGKLIVRKLLGNYDLFEILSDLNFTINEESDDTLFYTNVVIASS